MPKKQDLSDTIIDNFGLKTFLKISGAHLKIENSRESPHLTLDGHIDYLNTIVEWRALERLKELFRKFRW